MATVLITGSEGFLGRRLAAQLLTLGHRVAGIARPRSDGSTVNGVEFFGADILDAVRVDEIFQVVQPEIVYHLAAVTAHRDIIDQPEAALQVALAGTLNCLASFSRTNARCFIYSSSGKVYGKIDYTPLDEAHPCRPKNILGRTKILSENLLAYFAPLTGRTYVTARIFNVYGPGQKNQFVVPTILKQLAEGKTSIQLGNTTDKRDYIFVDDVIDALCLVSEKVRTPGFHAINIGSGSPTSIGNIIAELKRILGRAIFINIDPSRFRQDEDPVEFSDNRLARELLGWKPRYSLADGLRIAANYYLSEEGCR